MAATLQPWHGHVQAKAYSAAANMYGAALIYAATDMDKAQTARQLSLCHLGMGQQSKYVVTFAPCFSVYPLPGAACQAFYSRHHVTRALDYVDIAEQSQPETINAALIRFKVLLAMGNGDAAMQQLERCMACSDFEPIYLTVRVGPRSWHGHAHSGSLQFCAHVPCSLFAGGNSGGLQHGRHSCGQVRPAQAI